MYTSNRSLTNSIQEKMKTTRHVKNAKSFTSAKSQLNRLTACSLAKKN